MQDDDATPEERLEAEALAKALERDRAEPALPDDALETAALLRYARDGGALGQDKQDAILKEILETARPPKRARTSWLLRFRWPLLAALSTAATVAVFVAFGQNESAQMARTAAIPPPSTALLRAQLSAASGGDLAQLEIHMRPYRAEIVQAMEGRYAR